MSAVLRWIDGAWRLFGSRWGGAIGLVLLAVVLAPLLWVPQAPMDIAQNEALFTRWIASQRVLLEPWGALYEHLGLFALGRSPVLRVVLALIAVGLTVALTEGLRSMGRSRRDLDVVHPARFFEEGRWGGEQFLYRHREVVVEGLRHGLERWWKSHTVERPQGWYLLFAKQFPSAWGPILAHAGGLVVLFGLALMGRWGWAERGVNLIPGEEVALAGGMHVGAEAGTTGIEVVLRTERGRLYRREVTVDQRVRMGGMVLEVTEMGTLLMVRGESRRGELRLQGYKEGDVPSEQVRLFFDRETSEGYVAVPDWLLVLRFEWQAGDWFHWQCFVQGQTMPIAEGEWRAGEGEIAVADGRFWLETLPYAKVNVWSMPGDVLVGAGGLLLAFGLLLRGLVERGRVWVMLADERGGVVVKWRSETKGGARWVRDILAEMAAEEVGHGVD